MIINVTAEASAEIPPDRTKLLITHKVHRYNYDELSRAVNNELGIIASSISHYTDAKLIIDRSYTHPVYVYNEKSLKNVNNGYEYIGNYSLDISLEAVLFDEIQLALMALNLNLSIASDDYSSKSKSYSDKLIKEAINNARAKADTIASSFDKEVIGVKEASYNSSHMPIMMRMANDINVERSNIRLTENVSVQFIAE